MQWQGRDQGRKGSHRALSMIVGTMSMNRTKSMIANAAEPGDSRKTLPSKLPNIISNAPRNEGATSANSPGVPEPASSGANRSCRSSRKNDAAKAMRTTASTSRNGAMSNPILMSMFTMKEVSSSPRKK